MKSLLPRPHLLVTATVKPQIHPFGISNPRLRLQQYLEALSNIKEDDFGAITVVENSGTDFGIKARNLFLKTEFEFICYNEKNSNCRIAELESNMYSMFLRCSDLIKDSRPLLKTTGRYTFENINDYINYEPNIALSFRPTFGCRPQNLLTSIFKVNLAHFKAFEEHLRSTDFSNRTLEGLFADYVNLHQPRSVLIPYPRTRGMSGTFATEYNTNTKEQTRIALSKFIPFGLEWK